MAQEISKEYLKKYRSAYHAQKTNAKKRGIGWGFTFDTWIEWWGEDISRRGSHKHGLQMQRFGDKGDYEPGNVRKGVPKQNSATLSRTYANRKSELAKQAHEAFLDSLMWQSSKEYDFPENPKGTEIEISTNGSRKHVSFLADK